ncbi:MAG: DUF3579 domain-containing protein [Pseudomonadota bacterium]
MQSLPDHITEFVIEGITKSGEPFRTDSAVSSDEEWTKLLCNMLATTDEDGHTVYSEYLRPIIARGIPCVVVRADLRQADPETFAQVEKFATDNQLRVRAGRSAKPAAALSEERRDPGNNIW